MLHLEGVPACSLPLGVRESLSLYKESMQLTPRPQTWFCGRVEHALSAVAQLSRFAGS